MAYERRRVTVIVECRGEVGALALGLIVAAMAISAARAAHRADALAARRRARALGVLPGEVTYG